jgi:hypothetical protein
MKKYKIVKSLVLILLMLAIGHPGFGQPNFEVRTVQNDIEYLEVQIRETSGTGMPATTSDITDLQFELRWPVSYGSDLQIQLICDDYNLVDGLSGRQVEGSDYWHVFAATNVPFNPAQNWVQNQWETVAAFEVFTTSSSGTGTFEIPPDLWVVQGLNFGLDGEDFTPVVNGTITNYEFPTRVYNFVWRGGDTFTGGYDENSWTLGSNWEDPCGVQNIPSYTPTSSDNCLIPGGLTYYPSNFQAVGAGACNLLRLKDGGEITIPNGSTLTATKALVESASDIIIETGGVMNVDDTP